MSLKPLLTKKRKPKLTQYRCFGGPFDGESIKVSTVNPATMTFSIASYRNGQKGEYWFDGANLIWRDK